MMGRAKGSGRHQRRPIPVNPAALWMRVVSRASARVIAGRIVVSRRASIDLPAPGGPRRRTFESQRLHHVQVHCRIGPERRLSP